MADRGDRDASSEGAKCSARSPGFGKGRRRIDIADDARIAAQYEKVRDTPYAVAALAKQENIPTHQPRRIWQRHKRRAEREAQLNAVNSAGTFGIPPKPDEPSFEELKAALNTWSEEILRLARALDKRFRELEAATDQGDLFGRASLAREVENAVRSLVRAASRLPHHFTPCPGEDALCESDAQTSEHNNRT